MSADIKIMTISISLFINIKYKGLDMKIVFVIDTWQEGNGCVVATKRLAAELEKRGHEYAVVTTGVEKYGYEGEFYEVPGFYLPGVKESMVNMGFLFGRGLKKTLREAYKGADLVQIQFPFFMARNAVNVANEMGIPVIGATHLQPQNVVAAAGSENKLMEKGLYWLFNRCLYNHAKVLHSPSQFAVDLFKSHGSKSDFRVISNGIPNDYVPMKFDRPEEFGDYFTILNIGRHALEKRQELLIDGVLKSKYKDKIKLILAGRGERSEIIKERAKELPIEPIAEYISMEDKLRYLNTADLYLHSSIIELESLSCLEAIGCGLPCLISDATYSAASQFAYDDRFLFPMDDAETLGKKIDYMYENSEELKKLKPEIIKMAEKYRFDKSVNQMEDLYRELIRKNKTKEEQLV